MSNKVEFHADGPPIALGDVRRALTKIDEWREQHGYPVDTHEGIERMFSELTNNSPAEADRIIDALIEFGDQGGPIFVGLCCGLYIGRVSDHEWKVTANE